MIKSYYYINKEIILNFIWRGLQIFGKQGITFFIFILCAKLLSPHDFGIYNYVLAILALLIFFGDFGISTAVSKYVAEYNKTDKNKLRKVLFNSIVIIFVITILVTILTLIIAPHYLKEEYTYIFFLLPLIFLSPATSLYDGIYRGLKKFKQLAVISLMAGLISIGFVYFLVTNYGLIGALISQNIFYFSLLLSLAFGYKEFSLKIDKQIVKEIGKYSLIIGLGNLGFFLYSRVDVLFLGHYGFIEQINYLEIINKVLMLCLTPFLIFGQVISPNITHFFIEKNYSKLIIKFKKYLFFSLIFSLLAVITIFFSSNFIISSFLKEYYSETMMNIVYLMLIVFITQFLNGVIPFMVTATGHARLSTVFLVTFGILHVLLNYVFINIYGFIGIFYSIIITKVLADLLFIFIYYKILIKLRNKSHGLK